MDKEKSSSKNSMINFTTEHTHKEKSSIPLQAASHFTVTPYQQPGHTTNPDFDQRVILWQTKKKKKFLCKYRNQESNVWVEATLESYPVQMVQKRYAIPSDLNIEHRKDSEEQVLYRAQLGPLALDSIYEYQFFLEENLIYTSKIRTRTTKNSLTFVVLGDSGAGTQEQEKITQQIVKTQQTIDFALHVGDFAYHWGEIEDYHKNIFPYYNTFHEQNSSSLRHESLMGAIPLYVTLGNHDIGHEDPFAAARNEPIDLGFFHYHDLPLNGPEKLKFFPNHCHSKGNGKPLKMANYSFDYGPAHFTVLDGNNYFFSYHDNDILFDSKVFIEHANQLKEWIEKDLAESKAKWKFIAIHHPPFCSYIQQMSSLYKPSYMLDSYRSRVILEVTQKYKVDAVFSGHFHAYERSHPLRYKLRHNHEAFIEKIRTHAYDIDFFTEITVETDLPCSDTRCQYVNPKGTLFLISGAGGHMLYKTYLGQHDHTISKYVAHRNITHHSYTEVNIEENKMSLFQKDLNGNIVDCLEIIKDSSL